MNEKNISLSRNAFLLFFSILFCFFFFEATVFAISNTTESSAKLRGLTLSPLRTEIELAPGTSAENVMTVTNSTDKPMAINLNAEVFSVINQQYDYAFTAESDVVKWVSFRPSSFELKAGDSIKSIFTVNVPLQSEPGGRYLSLFANNNTTTSGNGLSSRQRIASLLYITVTGDVSREGHLLSLTSPWLLNEGSIWSVALQNTGSTHFRSRHDVQILNLFGKKDSAASVIGESLILPGSVRSISGKLPVPQWPGIYKILYTIGLGDTPAQIETRYVLYAPPLSVFIFIVIVGTIIYWFNRKRLNKKH